MLPESRCFLPHSSREPVCRGRYGGRQQGGISPSRETPVIRCFTDPATGHRHGYYDGWDSGLWNYVGEGQTGDQRFVQGNKAILQHREDGRALEGFAASGRDVTYLGEFELVDTYERDAHETGDENRLRKVIVFRLRPLTHRQWSCQRHRSPRHTSRLSSPSLSRNSTPNEASWRPTASPTSSNGTRQRSCSGTVATFKALVTP
jgi:hypothetical protein